LKITLLHTDPPIWRRIRIADYPLHNVHELIQVAMGWERCHLYAFVIGGKKLPEYPDELDGEPDDSVWDTKLSDVAQQEGAKFRYIYDFGDGWEHEVVVEKIVDGPDDAPQATCMAGERRCPPEDVGGVPGYEAFLEAISDPNHESHKQMLNWMGGSYDPDEFRAEAVNEWYDMLE